MFCMLAYMLQYINVKLGSILQTLDQAKVTCYATNRRTGHYGN